MSSLVLDIVTPEKRILHEENVAIVTLRTVEGEIGVLPGHIPLYSQLAAGELRYKKDNEEYFVAIHGGFLEVANSKVTVLADAAARAEELDEAQIEEARRKAEEAMSQKITDEDYAIAEGAMRRALLDLSIARKKRHTH
jgi:F-type H+-transporting ATPase subunit epsilon